MGYAIRPLEDEAATTIATWRYAGQYAMYDWDDDAVASVLDPTYQYFGVFDTTGELVGFCNFGEDARVSGFTYTDDALDVGVGMRPDLTGARKGLAFARAVLEFAQRTYVPLAYRVTIAAFNRRARRLCLAFGFREVDRFVRDGRYGDEASFVVLRRDEIRTRPAFRAGRIRCRVRRADPRGGGRKPLSGEERDQVAAVQHNEGSRHDSA